MKHYKPILALVLIMLLMSAGAASAQTVDVRSTAVEVLNWLANALVTVVIAAVTVGIRLLMAKFGLANSQFEQNLNDRLSDIIHKGMDFALATAINEVQKKGSGLEAVKFDNYFMSLAASYVNARAPEILTRFKVSQEKLEEMIWARIPAYMQTVPITGGAATPATGKEVNRATGGPNVVTPAPVVVTSKVETALPDDQGSAKVFREAPETGS
jgi:hypothetical protein